jgi:predicted negative regulator of RcsB-dependent stress response
VVLALAAGAALGGCAYYNGLYNANRLASEASRAERDGRTSEARSLWSQAAVKAESVVSRHPRSKWRDDALLLEGTALERLGSCSEAVRPLGLAVDSSQDRGVRMRAGLLLGSCRLQMGEPDSALLAVAPVLEQGQADDRNRARLMRGHALLALGRDEAALEELTASGAPEAAFPRAVALARLNRRDEATTVLQAVVPAAYSERNWLPTLDSVGRGAPMAVSGLVDQLAARPDLRAGQRLRLWLDDGERWLAAADTPRATGRFERVRAAGADSAEGRTAHAYVAVFATARARDWTTVESLADSLDVAVQQGGEAMQVAGRYVSVLGRAAAGLEPDGSPLALFVAAEDVRDSLANPALAGSLFTEVHVRYPESALGPKALLALAALRPADTDSLVTLLRTEYPSSPYTLALVGEGGDAYRALEDSLRRAITGEGRRRTGRGEGTRRVTEEAPRRVRNNQ